MRRRFDHVFGDGPAVSPGTADVRFSFSARNVTMSVTTRSPRAGRCVRLLYGDMQWPLASHHDVTFGILKKNHGYIVVRNGRMIRQFGKLEDALPSLDWMIMSEIVDWNRAVPVIHAGAVSAPEGIVMFAGPSGQGKSTSVISALCADSGYITDDVVLVLAGGTAGVPRAVCLSERAAQAIENLPNGLPSGLKQGERHIYVPASTVGGGCKRGAKNVWRIVLLERNANVNGLRRIGKAEAMHGLAGNLFDTKRYTERKLNLLSNITRDAETYVLRWRDPEYLRRTSVDLTR